MVANDDALLMISGNGDVVEPEREFMAIGSGAGFARAAAHALVDATSLSAEDIVRQSLTIAADICIYTNHSITIETLGEHTPS